MPDEEDQRSGEWRLGEPPPTKPPAVREPPPAKTELGPGDDRLARPFFTITVEHFGWTLVALYAIGTRLIALGQRPMLRSESVRALLSYHIANDGLGSIAAQSAVLLTDLERAQVFAAIGASDQSSRLFSACCGLLLIASAFTLRRRLGRPSALALAVLLTISPTVTWVSREASASIAPLAFGLAALSALLMCIDRPRLVWAVLFGLLAGVAIASGPLGILLAAAGIAALLPIALINAVAGRHTWLRIRVWWTRRRGLVFLSLAAALVVWIPLLLPVTHHPLIDAARSLRDTFTAGVEPSSGLRFYLPIIALQDFAIVLAAAVGLVATVLERRRRYFWWWCVLWVVLSAAALCALPVRSATYAPAMVVPLALVGAIGLQWLYGFAAWKAIRYPIAAVLAVSIWMQALANALVLAPDPGRPPWRQHAVLFWQEGAGTYELRSECDLLQQTLPDDAKVFLATSAPEVEWYFRDFERATSPEEAQLVVNASNGEASGTNITVKTVVSEGIWNPPPPKLPEVGGYLLDAHAWGEVLFEKLDLATRASPSPTAAPTSEASPTPSVTPAPSPSGTPAPSGTSTPSGTPTPNATATPSPGPTTEQSPAPTLSSTPAPSPTAQPSATAPQSNEV
ncbi:MAG TPA: glycosyltransferase family 39 protein [Candidatus Binataceae bacterium]|nr:glycosyltransferase family 39 protein [Candidatus Binataceae bacterium]